MATVLLSSDPVSMMRRQSGIISVVRRKLITSELSFLTKAPMTPRDVRRRYSNGRDFEVVLRNGYKKSGMCARMDVSGGLVTNCGNALTVQEESSCLIVRCDTLKQCQCIAHAVGGGGGELRGIEESIDGDNLLQQGSHHAFVHESV